jgi:hypothetical protein
MRFFLQGRELFLEKRIAFHYNQGFAETEFRKLQELLVYLQ